MIINVPLTRIVPNPWQTRWAVPGVEYIEELAKDIDMNGLLQLPVGRMVDQEGKPVDPDLPAVVLDMSTGKDFSVQLAFGHNRLAAYHFLDDHAGGVYTWSTMPVEVKRLSDTQMAVMAWSENEKRRDVTAIERAWAIQQRLEHFGWSNRECAEALGIDHSTVANILRLLKLPEEIQTAIQEEKLSERQAMALLPLFEAPVEFKLLPNSYGWSASDPHEIVKEALAGSSSDHLRGMVNNYFENVTQDLSEAEFKLDQLIPEEGEVYCGLCTTCDKRMASRNRCFSRLCYAAKTTFVHQQYLKKASFSSGYPILDDKKSGNPSELPTWEHEKREQILATKCPNLCLEWTGHKNSTSLEHFPHARIVCEMRNGSCRCQKGLEAIKEQVAGRVEDLPRNDTPPPPDLPQMVEGHDAFVGGEEPSPAVVTPQPLSAGELEDAARQARKEARNAQEKAEEYRKLLEEHLYQAACNGAPGVYYVAVHKNMYPSSFELTMEKQMRKMASEAARFLMPSITSSESQLVKAINFNLQRVDLPDLGSYEKVTQEDVTIQEL